MESFSWFDMVLVVLAWTVLGAVWFLIKRRNAKLSAWEREEVEEWDRIRREIEKRIENRRTR